MIGKTISHYKILAKLGGGGMGVVYKARDVKLKRTVALKFLPPDLTRDDEAKERFMLEAQAASALDHPNLCTIYEIDETEDGQMFIAMACYEGHTLKSTIDTPLTPPLRSGETGGLPIEEAASIAIQIARGLAKAHEQGIVHRDIKPANLIVTRDGVVKIVDFGLAKLTGVTQLTKTGTTLGTVAYMSPEQARGETVDHRTDIWSLGVVLYQMVSGALPFRGEYEQAVIYSILNEEPHLKAELPPKLRQIVAKALVKEPEERYQQMADMLAELNVLKKELEAVASEEAATTEKLTPSIAILPFVDMSPEKDQEYFCDGMAEELIDAFTKLEGLKVASRTSAFQFKEKEISIKKIGKELEVNHVLEGSVRKAGNRLRITAQLINVVDGYHLWSEKYDRELEDVFAIQDDIASTIVDTLKVKLVGEPDAPLIKRYTENIEAYQLYLKGRYFWNKRHEGGMQQAMECFQQVIEKESKYALAYVGLADCFIILGFYNYLRPKEAFPKAKMFAHKALQIDETIAEAHTSLGFVTWDYEWDWLDAEKELKRALELNPSYATGHWWYSLFLMTMGRTEESLAEIKRAQELDPLSLAINAAAGYMFFLARQHDRAINQSLKTLQMEPNFGVAHMFLGWAYEQKSMYEEAIDAFQKGISYLGGGPFNASLARTYALSGRTDETHKLLEELHELSKERYVGAYQMAAIYAALDEKDQAFERLEMAYEERNSWLIQLKVDPIFDGLRSDSRFKELLKKVALEP